jgi:hypothetical protein
MIHIHYFKIDFEIKMKIKKISPHENSTPRKINSEIASNFLTVHLIFFVFLAECAANLQENRC